MYENLGWNSGWNISDFNKILKIDFRDHVKINCQDPIFGFLSFNSKVINKNIYENDKNR